MEEIDTSNLIPLSDGDFMRHKSGEKKGQYITIYEFSDMSPKKQAGVMRGYDPSCRAAISEALKIACKRPEVIAMRSKNAIIAAEKLRNDPEKSKAKSEKVRANKLAEAERVRNDPELLSKKVARSKEVQEQIKNDPVRQAAIKVKMKAAQDRIRNDPVLWAAREQKKRDTKERNKLAKLEAQTKSAP